MSAAGFLLGFLIAFVVVWLLGFIGIALPGEVLKWGKIVVGLLCLIAVVAWLLGAVGGISTPHLRWG